MHLSRASMESDFVFENSFQNLRSEFADRITICGMEFPLVRSIKRGVVFVHAVWSGPSVVSLQRLTHQLKAVPLNDFQFFLYSSDYLGQEFLDEYGKFPSSGGWGECFWISDGAIIHVDGGYHKVNGEQLVAARIEEFFPS